MIDIKRGSGSYPILNGFGTRNTLIEPAKGRKSCAILSASPSGSNSGQWSEIARDLAGSQRFFHDVGEHSMLFQPRSETLVVTFDILDTAMEKRDERRSWGLFLH